MQRHYVIDGFNLLHAAVLKGRDRRLWWKASNQRRVIDLVERFVGPGTLVVVFDAARGPEGPGEGRCASGPRVEVRYARSADEEIVSLCQQLAGRSPVVVVSADRALRDRCRAHGAEWFSPFEFARVCIAEQPATIARARGSAGDALYKSEAARDTSSDE